MARTPEEIGGILDAVQGMPNLFEGQSCWKSIDELYDERKIYLLVDNVGIICFVPRDDNAHVHITFWDKRLRGRELLCKVVAREMMQALGLRFLWTAIPESARVILAFTKRLGFREARRFGPTIVLEYTNGN